MMKAVLIVRVYEEDPHYPIDMDDLVNALEQAEAAAPPEGVVCVRVCEASGRQMRRTLDLGIDVMP